jgi:hypothetical protein
LIYKNFLGDPIALNGKWATPQQRYTRKDPTEIYFIFFQAILHFLDIFKFTTFSEIFNSKRNPKKKKKTPGTVPGHFWPTALRA